MPEVPARWRGDPLLAENYLDGYRRGYDATMAWGWHTMCRRGPVEPAVRAWDKGWYDARIDAEPVFDEQLDRAIDRRDRDALLRLFGASEQRDRIVEQIVAEWASEATAADTATELPLR
ncbi:MAG: hypothetical protein H6835_02825 [Planctomycetes bacterium]|nr:hypothetical protein [Planctomycetota bacterium]